MKVLSLELNNILSIEHAAIAFADSGLILVDGWNFDANRANGAGKTAIFNALSFALYGEVPRKITVSEVLRNGTKKGFAEAVVETDDGIYSVRRGRPKSLIFKKNGQEETMTQEEFEHKIKLSYDQFLVSMYTAQESQKKFLYLNDTQKKDFLLQLMNLNEFTACRKEADAKIKSLDAKIADETLKIERAKSKIDAYSESIDIKHSQEVINSMQEEIDKLKAESKQIDSVSKPDLSKYFKLESDIQNKLEKLASIRYARNSAHDQFIRISNSMHPFVPTAPDAECPHCHGELMVQGKSVTKPDDVAAHRANHEAAMEELKKQMAYQKELIDGYDDQLTQESALRNLLNKSRERKEQESREYNKAQSTLSNILVNIESRESVIRRETENIKRAEELKEKIAVLKEYAVKAAGLISQYSEDREIHKAVSGLYAPTGAPAYIMDSIVDSFNEIVGDHISLVWPNATYSLQSYKENKDGDLIAKFSESLVINGKQRSIGGLSGGEQRALSLSIDFAIIDILSQQFGIPLNPVIMDEPFEGLDATGREIVIELLNKLSTNRQIWIIDHASEVKSMFSQIIRVHKRNGVSKIVS